LRRSAGYLIISPGKRADDKARNDGCDQSGGPVSATADAKGEREGKRHRSGRQPREKVFCQGADIIARNSSCKSKRYFRIMPNPFCPRNGDSYCLFVTHRYHYTDFSPLRNQNFFIYTGFHNLRQLRKNDAV
jgi:hypothetical protein